MHSAPPPTGVGATATAAQLQRIQEGPIAELAGPQPAQQDGPAAAGCGDGSQQPPRAVNEQRSAWVAIAVLRRVLAQQLRLSDARMTIAAARRQHPSAITTWLID
eukprot:COSAG01_NODE_16288_length_1250_cov_1.907037_2_plen_105_part_00